MRHTKTRRLAAVGLLVAAMIGLVGPSAAQADDGAEPQSASASPLTLPGFSSASSVIVCTPNAQYPHDSSHVGGTVNGVGTISCTAPVSSLAITVTLLYSGVAVAGPTTRSNAGQAFIAHNAATTCVPGYYQTRVTGWVVFPPGYVPSSGPVSHTSPSILVDCA